jgi:hypothetical protein
MLRVHEPFFIELDLDNTNIGQFYKFKGFIVKDGGGRNCVKAQWLGSSHCPFHKNGIMNHYHLEKDVCKLKVWIDNKACTNFP